MSAATGSKWFVVLLCGFAVAILFVWPRLPVGSDLKLRVPGTDAAPQAGAKGQNPVATGIPVAGAGRPATSGGAWPQFRGAARDGQASVLTESRPLARDWQSSPPRELWGLDVGEGYAGVAIQGGCLYFFDYDRDTGQSSLRCCSLADGGEIWRFRYPLVIKRNHGMTRTVPAVAADLVVGLDSKCNVLCLDAASGALRWSVNLVADFGATIPEWYAGQCPLVEGDQVILAPGGKNALLLALDLRTGRKIWQTPNPHDWKMTHSSVVAMDYHGRRQYVYCASKGVAGVDASTGALLWETPDWKISIATVPSPVPLPEGRLFLSGGYNAGSMILQLGSSNDICFAAPALKLPAHIFGATQHTPIFKDEHLYGVRADGRFVCLTPDGKLAWSSGAGEDFGLGPYLMAGDLIYALNDAGQLSLLEAQPARFNRLGRIQPLNGRESWAPMALADGYLVLRDLTRLVCLDVAAKP